MEMQPLPSTPPVVAKKLWNIVRVVLFMLRKGIAKSKIVVELNLLLKRGKLAGKAIANSLMLIHHHHHHAAFTCRSHDAHLSFISQRDYEFSCSNTPAHPIKRSKLLHFGLFSKSHQCEGAATVNAAHKMLEMLSNADKAEAASPLVTLPGFGKSPVGKQLRVTDSPFPLNDEFEGDSQVDKAAEEFIKRFYKDLKLQNTMAALESPYHNTWDR